MHMAFLSRVFKNLQWYGMTRVSPYGTYPFLFYKFYFLLHGNVQFFVICTLPIR